MALLFCWCDSNSNCRDEFLIQSSNSSCLSEGESLAFSDVFSLDPFFGIVMGTVPGSIVSSLFLQPYYLSSNKIIFGFN